MPPVTQRIADFLGGVSQQAPHRRRPNELEASLNALHAPVRGFGKRRNTVHIDQLSATPGDYNAAAIYGFDFGPSERYFAAFLDGSVKVWDENGVAQEVNTPHGGSYLDTDTAVSESLTDDFTGSNGTELDGRISEPYEWTRQYLSSGSTDPCQIQSNALVQTDSTGLTAGYTPGLVMPTADYRVSILARVLSAAPAPAFAIGVRVDPTTGAGYWLQSNGDNPAAFLLYHKDTWAVAGGTALVDIDNTYSLDPSVEHEYALEVAANVLTVYVDGVEVATVVDNTITTAGSPGLRVSGGATTNRRFTFDNFTVSYTESVVNDDPSVIRAVPVGNRIFVANRNIKVLRDTTAKAEVHLPQALLYVDQADFSTRYEVMIDGLTVTHETAAGTDPSIRREISTDNIAAELLTLLDDNFSDFSFEQHGSIILVRRTDDGDFTINTKDGLGDNGLRVIKSRVQNPSELPFRCLDGFVLEVTGDPATGKDNYWMKFQADDSESFRGVWKETVRPGEATTLDATTMPHELVYSDELTPQTAHKGFPAQPTVRLSGQTAVRQQFDFDLDGDNDNEALLATAKLDDHEDDVFYTLESANGGPIRVVQKYDVDTTQMTVGETMFLTLSHNDGNASTTWTEIVTLSFGAGLWLRNQVLDVDVSAAIEAGWDLRLQVTYGGGSTPADKGQILLPNYFDEGFTYYIYTGRSIVFNGERIYPKHTVWTVDVDGTEVTYTQTEDETGEAIATALELLIEDILDVTSFVTDMKVPANGIAINISKTATTPAVTCTGALAATHFWNPDVDFGTAEDFTGKTLRNLSDGSSGEITAMYEHGFTVESLAGGVENIFRDGDLCVVMNEDKTFTFRQVAWKEREAGSVLTNPWPSFVDSTVRDVFYHGGRLGILSGSNVVMSEAATPENFFRTATTDLIDSDVIDVAWAGGSNVRFHSAVPWNEHIVFFGDRVQIIPQGSPLSPKTIRLELLSAYPADPSASPEPAGRWVFFGRPISSQTQIQALGISPRSRTAQAVSLTEDLPSYLAGAPRLLAADAGLGLLLVVTDSDPSTIYHLRYRMEEDQPPLISWGSWEFTGEVIGMEPREGVLYLLMKYSDGVYLETLDLSENY